MSNSPIPRTGVYRSSYGPPTPSPLPLLWDDALDSLIRRTLRAYFLITSYERDSHGGTRWSSEDIAHIEAVGKYLPENVRVLDDWQHTIGREGEKDASTMGKIRYGAEQVRRCCEQIQGLIETTERIPIIQRITRGSPERGDQSGEDYGEPYSHVERSRDSKTSRFRRYQRCRSPSTRQARQWHEDGHLYRPERQEGESYRPNRPNRRGIAGSLGNHILHY